MKKYIVGILLLVCTLALSAHAVLAGDRPLLIFAAASTTNLVSELGQIFSKRSGIAVTNSFAASSTLAKQISQGAPAQVYISANEKWMDYLQGQGLLAKGTRVNLLRNQLVLIAPLDSSLSRVKIAPGLDLAALLAGGWLAMGNPDHVPAGIYGKQALTSLGAWRSIKGMVAASATVRGALALVELGEAPLGVVYSTDAKISRKVKVVGVFPPKTHTPIVYPAAVVAGNDTPRARRYLAFLGSDRAREVFRKYGFRPSQ